MHAIPSSKRGHLGRCRGRLVLVVTAVTILAALGKDTTALLAVSHLATLPILAAFGAALTCKVVQIRDARNGKPGEAVGLGRDSTPAFSR